MGDDNSEWLKLPTEEKIQHKAWKARVAGYEEATKLFTTLGEERSPEFSKYLGLIKKMVTDSNAIAQEKALDAVLAYAEHAHVAGRTTGEVCAGVVAKCLNSSRTKTKEKGHEILMMYIEIEKHEIVQEELMKGISHKQPKIVVGCIQALRMGLSDFGMKTIMIKPMVKQLQRLLEDRDKNVREETKLLAVEIYRWIGQALKPQLANLKPVQISELEAEFENLPPGRPQQTRFLRSQQDLKAKLEEQAAKGDDAGEDGDSAETNTEVDPFELIDAVDILSKIPKDYYEKIEAKKWQERREALAAVEKLVENPKIEGGDFHDLVKSLKKVITKDSNVMLVALAGKVLLGLAKGLRKKFSSYAVACVEVILDKFKEKKVTVVTVLRDAIDACFQAISLDPISEQCVAALENKNPSIKAETASFLARSFSTCTMATLPKKMLKMFIMQLLKTISDTVPDVREASFQALGTAMKVVGEKPIMPFLADVEPIKMTKIKECCENAVVVGKAPKSGGAASTATAGKAAPVAKDPKKETPKSIRGGGAGKKTEKDPNSGQSPDVAGAKKAAKPAAGGKKGAAKGKKGAADKDEVLEPALTDEAVEEICGNLLPSDILGQLANSNWKERLAAMEKFRDTVKSMPRSDINCQAFVRAIAKKPGFKETNFQVLKLKVDLVAHLAQNGNFSKRSSEYCLTDLVDKVGDVKTGSAVQEALSCIAETCTLEYVSHEVIAAAFEQKNPKNQSEALNWLAQAIKEFGFKVNIKPMLQSIKKAFAATNPNIRTAAITLVGVMYMYIGQQLRIFFEDEKPALLQQIDSEFDKVKGEKPPTPTRGVKESEGVEEEDEEEEEAVQEGINVADLVPRNDISGSITPELLEEMGDKNWKVRAEALQKVSAIINEAKFITPNIGGLPEALKARLGDSNKILVTTTVSICQTLATAMGPKVQNHVRVIGPGIIAVFGDGKPHMRAAAVGAANVWVEQCGLLPFVEAEILSEALRVENPNLRTELLAWMAVKLPGCKKLPAELNVCTPFIFACLEDRNADVRKKALEVLVPYMIHVGYESMARQASKLKTSSKDVVGGHLEKAKTELPAKPVKTKAAKAVKKSPEPESEDEEEVTTAPTPSVKENTKSGKAKGRTSVLGKKAPPASSKKKEEDVDLSPPFKVSNGKEQRQKDERNLRVLKWNFTTPRAEFVEQLRTQMEPSLNKALIDQLFHSDFKMHIKALDTMSKACENLTDGVMANLDLILKWTTLRFYETNTSVLLKMLEFHQVLFNMLTENDYHMTEFEAGAFIPYLINKVGDPKDNVRRDIRNIFKLICKVYPASKMFSNLLEGLKSKNTKQRTECLEELGCLIDNYGINVCQPSPAQALKLIATQIGTRDNSVRSAALNTVISAYLILGETVYKYIGPLSDKDQGMLEERIKRSAKNRPPTAVQPAVEERKPPTKAAGNGTSRQPGKPGYMDKNNRYRGRVLELDRPKREFEMDWEEEPEEAYEMPQLIEHDIDDILNDPVVLPKTRMRPPSPSVKLLGSSNDAKSAIDLVISQIASNDVTTSIQALTQVEEVLKDDEKLEMMAPHVDQYLLVCVLQLRIVYSKHMSDDADTDTGIRLYRCVLGSLLSLFQSKDLAKNAMPGVLKDLIYVLITIMLDQRLMSLEEGSQVVRSVNVIIVKIVQRSDNTAAMCALIRLLHESMSSEACSTPFLELIMKCLWKMLRMLPNVINDINVDRILMDLHNFLKVFPSHTWRTRKNDMPLRTIKTIVHSLAKLMGNKIMGHLTLIEQPHSSELESYLQRVLQTGVNSNTLANARNDAINGNDENVQTPLLRETKSAKRLSKTTHDMLAEIFKKIGSKENTREGLNDLYEFKNNYPEADLDPFLKKSSQFFQNYITRGLKNIEIEREGKAKQSTNTLDFIGNEGLFAEELMSSGSSGSIEGSLSQGGDDVDPEVYRERLKVLRARLGLDNMPQAGDHHQMGLGDHGSTVASALPLSKLVDSASSSLSSSSSSGIAQAGTSSKMESGGGSQTVNVADLKKRLDRIRNAGKPTDS